MKLATELINELRSICEIGYDEEMLGPHDEVFIDLVRIYSRSDADVRRGIRESVPESMRMLILGFGDRLAIVADRTDNKELLWLAFLAHSIEGFRHDDRENVFRLALLHHVAGKLGLDSSVLLENAANVSSPRAAECFRAFDARHPELKSLKTMKIIEVQTDSGVSYRYE